MPLAPVVGAIASSPTSLAVSNRSPKSDPLGYRASILRNAGCDRPQTIEIVFKDFENA